MTYSQFEQRPWLLLKGWDNVVLPGGDNWDIVHCLPYQDSRPHLCYHCWCRPRQEWVPIAVTGGTELSCYFIHNSQDGREVLETALQYVGRWRQ